MYEETKQGDIKHNLQAKSIWTRFLYMLLFVIFFGVTELVLTVVVIFQFLVSFTGKSNNNLRVFGQSLAQYLYDVIRFLTYNTDDLPFPFADWPKAAVAAAKPAAKAVRSKKKTGDDAS